MAEKKTTTDVTSDDRLWAALAYVFSPLSPIIIMLMQDKKERPFIRAHYVQAFAYGAALTVIWMLGTVLTLGFLGLCLTPFMFIAWIVALYWAYKAYQGEMVNIPVISDFVKGQGWA